jgi:ATP synthase protein I
MLQLRNTFMRWQISTQIRGVLRYQAITTGAVALALGSIGGVHWGLSAVLGGLVSVLGGAIYGLMLSRVGRGSAENALVGMLRAESAKILVIVLLLWLVFTSYGEVFGAGFIGTFIVTTLIFSLAIFIRPK